MDEATSVRHQRTVLVGAGALAGLVSALFGVGGGIVIVPILIAFAGYDAKRATSTSLAAIIPIAIWGTIAEGALGNVDWRVAALVGVPAMLGVTVGVAIKQRISTARLEIGFAVLMFAVAILLVVN